MSSTNNSDRVESVPFRLQTSDVTIASELEVLSQQLSGFQQQFSQQLSGFEQRITSKIDDVKDNLSEQRFTSKVDDIKDKLSKMQNTEDHTNKALKNLKDEMSSNHEELVQLLSDLKKRIRGETES